jgi:hypothetical protein
VGPGLDRLPGPLGQQARRDQPPHALLKKMRRDTGHIRAA